MGRGFHGLARQVQHELGQDPFSGHALAFRGRRGDKAYDADDMRAFPPHGAPKR